MSKYSEQDLRYAAEFRKEIHKEALAVVHKTHPDITEAVDRHPVEDYFQEYRDYPGKLYLTVAIPPGYRNRKALVDSIVRDTIAGNGMKADASYAREARIAQEPGQSRCRQDEREEDPFYLLLSEYPDLTVDYCIVKDVPCCGYGSHRSALKTAYNSAFTEWKGDPDQAEGKRIDVKEMFSSEPHNTGLNYREAFLHPPYGSNFGEKDFARVNAALFPNGTEVLEIYGWTTDWSEYFEDGHEWWGALCLTVYDKTLDRFVVITASATD